MTHSSRVRIALLLVLVALTACESAQHAAAPETGAAALPLAPSAEPVDCNALQASVESKLVEVSACKEDADCDIFLLECPFGCYQPVNPSADMAGLAAVIRRYKAACNECLARCARASYVAYCAGGSCQRREKP